MTKPLIVTYVEKDLTPDGIPIERMSINSNGERVEIIRENKNNAAVSVAIGGPRGSIKIMPADQALNYIKRKTE